MFIFSKFYSRIVFGLILFFGLFFILPSQTITHSSEQTEPIIHPVVLSIVYPNLTYSTFFGGSEYDRGHSIAVVNDGSYYITGDTFSSDFPILNAYNSTFGGESDVFITKFSSSGSLLWSTYLGGSSNDYSYDIAISIDGSCYIIGETDSSNFPTINAYNNTYCNNTDVFVAKFSPSGSLLWSTYLGGSSNDYVRAIALTNDGSCYITGYTSSSNFPTVNAFDSISNGLSDVFITKFSSSGSLLWSTYLGGNSNDYARGIAVMIDGRCIVTGQTYSSNFPTSVFNNTKNGDLDAFTTKFSSSGYYLWSRYLGGSAGDEGHSVAVLSDGSYYITGATSSSNFPIFNASDGSYNGGYNDVFVTKFAGDYNNTLLWSTYLGGSSNEHGNSLAVLSDGSCYITGTTSSSNFRTMNAYDSSRSGALDAFIAKFSSSGSLNWSTYLGGGSDDIGHCIAVTTGGSYHIIGATSSSNFPTLNAYDSNKNDIFISIFNESSTPPPSKEASNSFLILIVGLPIIALIIHKRRK